MVYDSSLYGPTQEEALYAKFGKKLAPYGTAPMEVV